MVAIFSTGSVVHTSRPLHNLRRCRRKWCHLITISPTPFRVARHRRHRRRRRSSSHLPATRPGRSWSLHHVASESELFRFGCRSEKQREANLVKKQTVFLIISSTRLLLWFLFFSVTVAYHVGRYWFFRRQGVDRARPYTTSLVPRTVVTDSSWVRLVLSVVGFATLVGFTDRFAGTRLNRTCFITRLVLFVLRPTLYPTPIFLLQTSSKKTTTMTTAPAKLYGKNLSEYDELDVDQLLSQLSPEEISILAKEVDPDVSTVNSWPHTWVRDH